MARVDARKLLRVEAELERRGLLLLHDRALPSVTALVAGEAIAGSWWGHPRGNEIYALVEAFEHTGGALSLKLVNRKLTFVHQRLWPALLVVASGRVLPPLSPPTLALLQLLRERGTLKAAELRRSGFLPPLELKRAIAEIETQIAAHVDSEHGDSGAHEKVVRRWADWALQHAVTAASLSVEQAGAEIERAAAALCDDGGRVRLPWGAARVA
jgi:hypothetical protein